MQIYIGTLKRGLREQDSQLPSQAVQGSDTDDYRERRNRSSCVKETVQKHLDWCQ